MHFFRAPTTTLPNQPPGRGITVIDAEQLLQITGATKEGKAIQVGLESQWLNTDPYTALEIVRRCPPVLGVVTGRANLIAGLPWVIEPVSKNEDRAVARLKDYREMFMEWDNVGVRIGLHAKIRERLVDIKPDLSNFDASLRRWSRRIKDRKSDESSQVEDWINSGAGTNWSDFAKQFVSDLLTHGRGANFKIMGEERLEGFELLPGGTVFPVQGQFAGGYRAYIQVSPGHSGYLDDFGNARLISPQLFFANEMDFSYWMPNSLKLNGLTPIDALLNLCAEDMLRTHKFATMADGSKPPHKVLVMTHDASFNPSSMGDKVDPVDQEEQRRVENKLNRDRKDHGITTLTQYGTPFMLDLSGADTMESEMRRQDQIDEKVALVFHATPLEMNKTGSEDTSGRSTSEAQRAALNSKGVAPIVINLEESFNLDLIPWRYGPGYYDMNFSVDQTAREEAEIGALRLKAGWAMNEVRVPQGLDPFNDPKFDEPVQAGDEQTDALLDMASSLRG